MQKISLLLLLVVSMQVLANVPTIESLFRNGSNREVSTDSSYVVFKYVEVDAEDPDEIKSDKEQFVRLHFVKENENHTRLLQFWLKNEGTPKANNLQHFKYIPNLGIYLSRKELKADSDLFVSIVSYLVLNSSEVLNQLLKKISPDFKSNDLLMERSKVQLLESYLGYLKRVKNNPELKETVQSPLKPEDPDKKVKVNEIMAMPMYRKTENVQLTMVNNQFFWEVNLGDFHARFTNEKRQLKGLKLQRLDQRIEANFSHFVLFDGIHELPKNIFYRTSDGRLYKITMLNLSYFNKNNKTYSKNLNEYKTLSKSLEANLQNGFPAFLL